MANKKEDRLRALIQAQELKTPAHGFTEEVMKEITLSGHEAAQEHDRFRHLMQSAHLTEPPVEFTFKVLKGVRAPIPQSAFKPVINRLAWVSIASFFVVCVVVGFIPPDSSADVVRNYDSLIAIPITRAMTRLQDVLPYLVVIAPVVVLLLGLEKRLKKEFGGGY
jgi:hypothetical protein